ncbi:hypothetical protein FOL47_000361, partial [Perkinsus chesapeaki]
MSSTKMLSAAQELMYEQRQDQKALVRGLKRDRDTRDGDNKRHRVDALVASEFTVGEVDTQAEESPAKMEDHKQSNKRSKKGKKQATIDSGAAVSVVANKLALALKEAGIKCEPTKATLAPPGSAGKKALGVMEFTLKESNSGALWSVTAYVGDWKEPYDELLLIGRKDL